MFQYRDIVIEVCQILRKHHPLVKPMTFVGQSSTGKQSKGFTQKQQLKVRNKAFANYIANFANLLGCW
jgi:ERCC4-related helicase